MFQVERGFSASPTVRHSRVIARITAKLQPAQHDWPHGPALTRHLQRHLGKTETVWQGIVSEFLHIDVHAYEPSPHWPAVVLVTEGMSGLPMMVPRELHPRWRWAELVLCLSRDWPFGQTGAEARRRRAAAAALGCWRAGRTEPQAQAGLLRCTGIE